MLLASLIPVAVFFTLVRRLNIADAAATAATYGSVSAVTFVTATSYLDAEGVSWQGYFVAAMALMESPAIIVGLLLYRLNAGAEKNSDSIYAKALLKESFLNGSVFLIMGSLFIGFVSSQSGMAQLQPVIGDLFTGVLCLFLLDMGIVAARRIKDIGRQGNTQVASLVGLGLFIPIVNAGAALGVCWLLGLTGGDALLLETHIFDFEGDLYDKPQRVQLIGFIRPEQKFNGLDELKAQIARDCDTARSILAETDIEQFSGS